MQVKIFDKTITLRDYYCQLDNYLPSPIEYPYINMYVLLTNKCNAKCKFCCNQNTKDVPFHMEKFQYVIQELSKHLNIRKVSFTGGEPTLHTETLGKCLHFIKETNPDIFTVINTNGTNIQEFIPLHNNINSIALSRHHYLDDVNQKIFNNPFVPTTEILKGFPHKEILHFSCNLMKSYIGNKEEVVRYLEEASKIGCTDIGFVSLMNVNDFCKDEFIDFKDLNFEQFEDVFITKNWNNENKCRCRNYVYVAKNAEVVRVYARYYISSDYNGSNFVFDGENLRLGFNGEIIV